MERCDVGKDGVSCRELSERKDIISFIHRHTIGEESSVSQPHEITDLKGRLRNSSERLRLVLSLRMLFIDNFTQNQLLRPLVALTCHFRPAVCSPHLPLPSLNY